MTINAPAPDRLTRLEEVEMSDFEAEILEGLKLKAGLVWSCPEDLGWINPEGEPCEECGRTQEESATE